MTEKRSLLLYQDMDFTLGKRLCIECCTKKERNGLLWLLTEVWKWGGIRKKTNKVRCPVCAAKRMRSIYC
jgi:hypothetical protein